MNYSNEKMPQAGSLKYFIALLIALFSLAAAHAEELVIMKQDQKLRPSAQEQVLGRVGNNIVVLQSDSNLCIYELSDAGRRHIWGFDQLPGWMEKGYQKTSEIWLAPNDLVVYAGGRNIAYSALIADGLQAFGGNQSAIEMVFDGNSVFIRKVADHSKVLWKKP